MMAKSRWRHNVMDIAAIVAVACLVILVFRELRSQPHKTPTTAYESEQVEDWGIVVEGRHQWGETAAPVTIVTFVDFECPACRDFALGVQSAVRAKYSSGELRIVIRHMPLSYHRLAFHAAKISECAAEQGRFFEIYELLFSKQDSLGLKSTASFATESGVSDVPAFEACVASDRVNSRIVLDLEAAELAGAKGTPTIVVNGLRLGRVPQRVQLEQIIDDAIEIANTQFPFDPR